MPLRLYTYLLIEMVRVIAITTGVLVTVIAFGAVIKPLAGESMLTAGQAVKYVFFAMIPMLQYALPFAAGFGSTLAMHRFVNDNEILAMSVSGLSYRTILAPVLAFGALLTLIMILLTQSVIPTFYGLMARTLAGDVTEMIAYSVERGVPFEFEGMQIYAEQVKINEQPPDTNADERIILRKMIAAELDSKGRALTDVTAAAAVIDIYRRPEVILMKLVMEDAVSWDGTTGELRGFPRLEPTHAIPIPSPTQGEPGAMSRSELLHVRDNPTAYPQVDRIRIDIAETLKDQAVSSKLNALARGAGAVDLAQPGPMNRSYTIKSNRVVNGMFSHLDGSPIVVIESTDGVPTRRFSPAVVRLISQPAAGLHAKQFNLEMIDLQVEDLPIAQRSNRRERIVVPDLQVPEVDVADFMALPLDEVVELAGQEPVSGVMQQKLDYLSFKIGGLERQVISRLNRRYALSLTALLLLMLGSVLAMLLRHSQPLVIYMLAFLPALLDLVLISSGSSMIRSGSVVIGLVLMWSGNGILLLCVSAAYLRLARH
jgi:lipopolysaccharide export LptBFGC system permease protein LptF